MTRVCAVPERGRLWGKQTKAVVTGPQSMSLAGHGAFCQAGGVPLFTGLPVACGSGPRAGSHL